jgi:hypothetical protein
MPQFLSDFITAPASMPLVRIVFVVINTVTIRMIAKTPVFKQVDLMREWRGRLKKNSPVREFNWRNGRRWLTPTRPFGPPSPRGLTFIHT